MKKLIFYATLFLLLGASCDKHKEALNCTITYDVVIPQNLDRLVDAYAVYEDNGETNRERITNGQFKKAFSYKWDGDAATATHLNFSSLKIYMYSRVNNSELVNGTKLLKDSKAYMEGTCKWSYSHDKDNLWTGASSSASSSGSAGKAYVWGSELQNYEYTVEEQENYLRSLASDPYISYEFDHTGLGFSYTLKVNTGQPDDDTRALTESMVNVTAK